MGGQLVKQRCNAGNRSLPLVMDRARLLHARLRKTGRSCVVHNFLELPLQFWDVLLSTGMGRRRSELSTPSSKGPLTAWTWADRSVTYWANPEIFLCDLLDSSDH